MPCPPPHKCRNLEKPSHSERGHQGGLAAGLGGASRRAGAWGARERASPPGATRTLLLGAPGSGIADEAPRPLGRAYTIAERPSLSCARVTRPASSSASAQLRRPIGSGQPCSAARRLRARRAASGGERLSRSSSSVAAMGDLGAASGHLSRLLSYLLGGLVGSAVLGKVFDRLAWTVCVLGLRIALALAAMIAAFLLRTTRAPASGAASRS
jgi:hypothetical protein